MCRTISNMLLVLFTVVLILPAFQGVGFLSGSGSIYHCANAVNPPAKILCELNGSNDVFTSRLPSCNVTCSRSKTDAADAT
uniref:Putative secreted salivary protein n=1 Tax=Ixodes scapularis TaxID=6945 RepID=Q4PMP0_IXOSC|nr:putative secreted salivary protein [Ixodes scapularis]